ncbi:hypothetical protein ACEPPN_002973 [Leptodophora sp. 'Broadleaf-Isolate-01']
MALDRKPSNRRPSNAMSSDSMSSDSMSSDTMSTDSRSKEEEEEGGKGHSRNPLLNKTQLNSILEYIDTIPSPLSRTSAKIYLARLHKASSSREARAYIMLFRSGKTILNDERLERYKHLNQYFQAPLVSASSSSSTRATCKTRTETKIKMIGLDDQFKIKTEMQMEMGEEWDVDDYEVRLDFGKVYIGTLFRFGFIEPCEMGAGRDDNHGVDDRLADEL